MESRLNSSGTFSQDPQRCSSVIEWSSEQFGTNTRNFHRKNVNDVNIQWHLLWQKRQQRWMLGKCRSRESICEKIWCWTMVFFGQGSEKKWYSSENSPQGAWDNIAGQMLLEFAESGHPIFRATTPLSRGTLNSKRRGKLLIHFAADVDTIDTIFRMIFFVNQFSIYGAVAYLCDEFENPQDGSREPEILMGSVNCSRRN